MEEMTEAELLARFDRVTAEIRRAEAEAGRPAGDAALVPAVKYAAAWQIETLWRERGLCDMGENRVQTLLEHWEALSPACRAAMRVHFIGSLQTNKVKYIIDKVSLIHSLDSLPLAAELEKQAAKHGRRVGVLVEINSGREANKGGVLPEETEAFCLALAAFPHLELRGFMTMAPKCEKISEYLNYFQETSSRTLDIWTKKLHNIGRPFLSMGMSDSLAPAIACGASCVRVGTSIFGSPAAAAPGSAAR